MPTKQATKPRGGQYLWTDEELLIEVHMCHTGDTFNNLARRLGYAPDTLADRLKAMGQTALLERLRPAPLDPAMQRGGTIVRRPNEQRRIDEKRAQRAEQDQARREVAA
ncbi:hypothetical protein [Kineosporia succinea]|uniref:AraC-like DNA-binding protein n=1 Tax=Kineosporia succinea TaxID=84632 RepID=A0ABT9P9H4_9ACTN|nr:hypothetical protein [Kineosporia succinea]MDP9829344.1 AraC-like DNA-binding protein [Kineosporia succinea]